VAINELDNSATGAGMTAWAASFYDGTLHGSAPPQDIGEARAGGMDGVSDAQLMQRFGNGDAEAFRSLYLRHRDRLYRYALRLAASPAEADEIFQEVWLAVVHGRVRYRPTASFVTYLFSIAHRRMIDSLRRRGRRWEDSVADENLERIADEVSQQPLEIALRVEHRDAMNAAVSRLPLMQREAFLMQAESGMTLEEIAEATQTGRETVKSRLRYAYARLRRDLEEAR